MPRTQRLRARNGPRLPAFLPWLLPAPAAPCVNQTPSHPALHESADLVIHYADADTHPPVFLLLPQIDFIMANGLELTPDLEQEIERQFVQHTSQLRSQVCGARAERASSRPRPRPKRPKRLSLSGPAQPRPRSRRSPHPTPQARPATTAAGAPVPVVRNVGSLVAPEVWSQDPSLRRPRHLTDEAVARRKRIRRAAGSDGEDEGGSDADSSESEGARDRRLSMPAVGNNVRRGARPLHSASAPVSAAVRAARAPGHALLGLRGATGRAFWVRPAPAAGTPV